ncbi:MAG: tetratricopeptide repeat protein [Verrucomicrobia bacterium]|nr:tetratricopeptide repeat protein [Verrucomicrobiota bacterium]
MSNGAEHRKLAAIMFTDMVGYTALTQRNEKLALQLLEEHRLLLRKLFPRFNGREIETAGDGFLVEFASALEAARCAIEIQRSLAARNIAAPPEGQIRLRIGIHVGDVVQKDGKLLGDGVNIAARLQPLAEPGGICISIDVARQIRHNLEATVVNVGEKELKNVKLPMEVCRIVLPWEKRDSLSVEAGASEQGRNRWLAFSSIALLVLAGSYLLSLRQKSGKVESSSAGQKTKVSPAQTSALDPRRIVVLPLDNFSPDANDEYFARGMTEELTSCLSKITNLTVIGRTSSEKVKKDGRSVAEIGRELRVGTLLEGSVRKAGDKVRITVQLIDVATEGHLLTSDFDRELKDVFAIQSQVAQEVAAALKIRLGAGEEQRLRKPPTDNLEAYKAYLLGLHYWNRRTAEAMSNAITHFESATQQDPKFALAHAMLADAYGGGWVGFLTLNEAKTKAKAAVGRALELDDTLAEAHAMLAGRMLYDDWDWKGAEREYLRALELNPGYATAHQRYSLYLMAMGRIEESLTHIRRAHDLDPISLTINSSLGWRLSMAGRHDQAIAQLQKTIAMDPSFVRAHADLGLAYEQKGALDKAIAELTKAIDLSRTEDLPSLGHAYARAGKRAQALEILAECEELSKQGNLVGPYRLAILYTGLGETDQALDALERAYREGSGLVLIKAEPRFKPLRTHPRFKALLRLLRLEN